jgi:hypothetical protein
MAKGRRKRCGALQVRGVGESRRRVEMPLRLYLSRAPHALVPGMHFHATRRPLLRVRANSQITGGLGICV